MDDNQNNNKLYDSVYNVVFDQLRVFHKNDLEELDLYKNKPSDHDELYLPFEHFTDRIIKKNILGERSAQQSRNVQKSEIDKLDSLLSQLSLLRDLFHKEAPTDEFKAILQVTAIRHGHNDQLLNDEWSALTKISSIIKKESIGSVLTPVIRARQRELASQNARHGKRNLAADFVAEECRVIWYEVSGQIAASSFKNFDQHFPQFVKDIFDVVFAKEDRKPSVRTSLFKSSIGASNRIKGLEKLKSQNWTIQHYENGKRVGPPK